MQPDRDREAAFEALLQGRGPGDASGPLTSFVDDVRAATGGPAPEPSPALALLLRGAPARDDRHATPPSRTAARLASTGLRVKVALGAALTATGVAAAGATGLLPEPVADRVRPIVELVTPFEVPSRSDPHGRPPGDDRAHRVATADDEGGPPATTPESSPAGQAGTGPPTAPASTAAAPASVAAPPRATATVPPPPSTTAAPASTAVEPSPPGNPSGASAGSPAPETNPQPHRPRTAPGSVPGLAGEPPASPGSPPPGHHGADQAHVPGGPPGGQAPGGPGAGASGPPDDPGPADHAGEGKPAATDVQAASTPVSPTTPPD
jgi:hypothetical protein